MITKSYIKWKAWIDRSRFNLLLLATIMVLVLPAFSDKGFLGNFLFIFSMSFLIMQSMVVATARKSKRIILRYIIVFILIILFVLGPAGFDTVYLDIIRLLLMDVFFVFVTFYLVRFMRNSSSVNLNVIITAINIYLLTGIISGGLAYLLYLVFPDAYNFPSYISEPNFVTFNYYSFITMATVGYGDITPRIPETQTLAYMVAITGQLYVAIIIAFLVGKLLMKPSETEK